MATNFAPEWSSARHGQLVRYVHAYNVCMSMPANAPPRRSRLTTRHWEVDNGGKIERVDGPGVVGLYPEMFPGANFSYQVKFAK